jgi:tetratricopeptide (TPR) repeat protein
MSLGSAWTEQRAGDLQAWEEVLRSGLADLERLDDRSFSGTVRAYLAESLYLQGRHEEAAELCAQVRATSPTGDVINFVYVGYVEGRLLAHEGRLREAEEVGRRALDLAETTDFFFPRAQSRMYLAETLAEAGKSSEAALLAEEGLSICAAKEDVTGATRMRERLDSLGVVAG